MDKRYQVFVSSTYEDLREERQAVIQALLELDCIPAGMEMFPATDEDQWSLIQKTIDDCDYYVVIIAGRYGSAGPQGKSYTQMEYEYASSKGKPVAAFLHSSPGKISAELTDPENREKLDEFRALVKKKMVNFWSSPAELGLVVTSSMVKLMKAKPGTGWVRADMVANESAAQEILRLKRRIEELEAQVHQARSQPPQGTAELAQGEDKLMINFRVPEAKGWVTKLQRTTWNKVFAALAPHLLDGANEGELRSTLGHFLKNREEESGHGRPSDLSVRDEDFQKIKIQLRALGLIAKDEQRQPSKGEAYWVLTPYGDAVMTKVAAVRSGGS
jgi:hypothetical protein